MLVNKLIIKGIILIWPWLKHLIFNDRTVMEVLKDNTPITILFAILITLAVVLAFTLSVLKSTHSKMQELDERYKVLQTDYDQLLLNQSGLFEEDIPAILEYDRSHIAELLQKRRFKSE